MRKAGVKRPLKAWVRELLVFMERLFLVMMAVSAALIFTNSFFQVLAPYGTTYHYGVSLLEKEKEFEEKDIFQSLLLGNMEQIIAYAAISNILETEGEYNGKKAIDITKYGDESEGGEEILASVSYYLDDLIAWGNYGVEYRTYTGSWDELSRFFVKKESTLPTKEGTDEIKSDEQYAMEAVVPTYRTVEGKDLMEYASSIEEYESLKACLVGAAEELFDYYSRYISLKEYCTGDKTNVKYYFKIPRKEGYTSIANNELIEGEQITDDITNLIGEKSIRFVFFDPDKVQINTNTHITAKQINHLLKEQEGLLPQGSKVWFWVERDYPVKDSFQIVRNQLEEFRPYLRMLERIIFLSFAGIMIIMIILTKKEGRAIDGQGLLVYETKNSDRIPVEIGTVFVIGAEAVLFFLMVIALLQFQKGNLEGRIIPLLIGGLAFTGNELAIRWYFSLIRRKKAGVFWKTTFLYLSGKKGKQFLVEAYENGGIIFRTWIPYLIFLMVNLILVLLGVGGVLGALLLDLLIGIFLYQQKCQQEKIVEGIERITEGDSSYRIDTNGLKGENLRLAIAVNSIGKGIRQAVESSMKDEKMKTDLITNVSHDIKTPLTSIITYVDLLKRENIREERVANYLDVLDNKSQRLKQLIDDLVEASKISSGNITFQKQEIMFTELVKQALGEFDEKFSEKQLQLIVKIPQQAMLIEADSSQLWRVMENIISNACKYSLAGTRIYVEMESREEEGTLKHFFLMKNISEIFLEVEANELTERFMRGDLSRKTEGSGLGLSIAKNLVEAMGGEFKIEVDGDLFKAVISFEAFVKEQE